jgi:predicted RNase H-like HicB family nuclease
MNTYFYPAIFTYDENDKCYMVDFIDLKGCSTFGKSLDEAYLMAQDALGLYLSDLEEFPKPTIPYNKIKLNSNQFISLIEINLLEYRKKYSNIAVKKTLTIPTWLNTIAERNDINFSQLLQKALKNELNIHN